MICLPISGEQARWRPATGHDDVALAESPPGLSGAVAYATRAATLESGAGPAQLPVGDLDLLIVARRRELRGDTLVAEGHCERCGAAVDVRFSLAAYADYHRPRSSRTAVPGEDGRWRLRGVTFRVPVVDDVLAAAHAGDPRAALLERCVNQSVPARTARAIERAMAVLAPTLRADVSGSCPECEAPVLLDVDARELCLAELRGAATAVFDDVNLIASVYRWAEAAILDLPTARRRRYGDLITDRAGEFSGAGVA